jgi:DUF4097 and DUF4098 domain-containing protein YvlB
MIRERFETPGAVALDISCAEGEIEIETTESAATEVEVDASDELLEAARVEHSDAAGRHEVVVRIPKRGGLFRRGGHVHVTVRAPEGADLRVDAASADTRARGRFGSAVVQAASGDVGLPAVAEAVVKTASGDVEVENAAGDVTVSTASGDVRVGRVGGSTTVRSASGDVTVREAASDVGISTASGDQTIGAVVQGRVELRSASGDVRVGIARGSGVWVDARSMSGDTTSELELGDAEPQSDESGPLVELSAISMSGDVQIARA